MKNKSLKKIIVFVAILCCLHLLLYAAMSYYISITHLIKIDQRLSNQQEEFTYLFMGDSHTAQSVDTTIITNAFNYAVGGESNIRTYYKLKNLLDKNKKPLFKTIVFSNDLLTFTTTVSQLEKSSAYYVRYINYWELGSIKNKRVKYLLDYLKHRFFPYAGFVQSKCLNRGKKQFILEEKNKATWEETLEKDAYTLLKQVAIDKRSSLYNATSVAYVKKTLDLCHANNLQVLFIKYPVTRYFKEAAQQIAPNKLLQHSPIDSLIQLYPNTKQLDLSNPLVNDIHYFTDNHHLNLKGKKAFSKLLKQELIKLK